MKNYFCFAEPQPILRRQAKVVQGESKTKKMKNYFWEDEVNKPLQGLFDCYAERSR